MINYNISLCVFTEYLFIVLSTCLTFLGDDNIHTDESSWSVDHSLRLETFHLVSRTPPHYVVFSSYLTGWLCPLSEFLFFFLISLTLVYPISMFTICSYLYSFLWWAHEHGFKYYLCWQLTDLYQSRYLTWSFDWFVQLPTWYLYLDILQIISNWKVSKSELLIFPLKPCLPLFSHSSCL